MTDEVEMESVARTAENSYGYGARAVCADCRLKMIGKAMVIVSDEEKPGTDKIVVVPIARCHSEKRAEGDTSLKFTNPNILTVGRYPLCKDVVNGDGSCDRQIVKFFSRKRLAARATSKPA